MIAQVNEQLWIDFNLDTAVFLDTIAYWIKKNAYNKLARNFHQGRYWTYNTQQAYQKMFPGWSRETIRRIIRNCVKNGLLLINNFNMKRYDKTNWFSLTDKAIEYYPSLRSTMYEIPENTDGDSLVEINQPLVGSNQAIPKLLTTISNNNIISDLDEKSGFMSNCNDEYLGALETAEFTGYNAKSDYQKNQCTKETLLLENEHILRKREDSSSIRINAIKNDEIVEAYHEVLPDCPKIKVIDTKLNNQLNHMKKNWPRYQKEGKEFSIDSFKDYLNYLKQHYSWFTKPYTTQNGNKKQNNLRVFTREINITKIVNGEFSVN